MKKVIKQPEEKDRKTQAQQSGEQAEVIACSLLQRRGLKIIDRNFHCKLGEVDIIAEDGGTLVFIEVRKRTHPDYGNGFDSVTHKKRQKIWRTAAFYLQKQKLFEKYPCRFDIVSADSSGEFYWIKDAFQF